jgi:phage major head subunit gpT-like protein
MAGLITTGNFSRGLMPGIKEWYGYEYNQYPPEYTQFMTVMKSDKRYEDIINVAGMGPAVVKNEGQSITYDDFKQGFVTRFINVAYAKGFVISYEAMEDFQYAPKLAEMGAKFMAKGMRTTKEQACANVLNNGFSSTYPGGDGQPLFSNAHVLGKGGTFSNIPTVAADLSEASLEQAVIDIGNFVDDAGLKIAVKPVKLVVSVNDQFNAARILNSVLRPGTADNDINALNSMGVIPSYFVSHYVTDTDAWFITTTENDNGLILMERTAEVFESDDDFDTKSSKFSVFARFVPGFGDPRGVYGSAGA